MNKLIIPVMMMLVVHSTNGQTLSGFSFGVITDPSTNQTTFTGPVIMKDVNTCLQVLNGLQKMIYTPTGRYADCPDKIQSGFSRLALWPNPASTTVRIRSSMVDDPEANVIISVIDASGQVVQQITTNLGQLRSGIDIPLLNHSSGMYMLRIASQHETQNIPFIKLKS